MNKRFLIRNLTKNLKNTKKLRFLMKLMFSCPFSISIRRIDVFWRALFRKKKVKQIIALILEGLRLDFIFFCNSLPIVPLYKALLNPLKGHRNSWKRSNGPCELHTEVQAQTHASGGGGAISDQEEFASAASFPKRACAIPHARLLTGWRAL